MDVCSTCNWFHEGKSAKSNRINLLEAHRTQLKLWSQSAQIAFYKRMLRRPPQWALAKIVDGAWVLDAVCPLVAHSVGAGSPEELLGVRVHDLVAPADHDEMEEDWSKLSPINPSRQMPAIRCSRFERSYHVTRIATEFEKGYAKTWVTYAQPEVDLGVASPCPDCGE